MFKIPKVWRSLNWPILLQSKVLSRMGPLAAVSSLPGVQESRGKTFNRVRGAGPEPINEPVA
jgi:hypothetical protein